MIRVGIGYDIHRLVPGRTLILGGIEVPCDRGLLGHSDADVVTHALMDALLGAAALDDIGQHFPPSDERFRGISSLELLSRVCDLIREAQYSVINVDIVVVAEQPRLAPFSHRMREKLAGVLAISNNAVGLKATTNEGMGPEGRLEAISARAVALLESVQ